MSNLKGHLTVCLHVGLPKTGTTTLQRALLSNADVLARAGLIYPESGLQGIGHHTFAPAMVGDRPTFDWIERIDGETLLDDLATEISSSPSQTRTVLLSSEALGRVPDAAKQVFDGLAERLKPFQRRVVIYLRRQDHYLESHFNQVLKTGARRLTDAELDAITLADLDPLLDYDALITRYERFLAPSEIVVCPFEREQLQPDLLSHFIQAVGVGPIEPIITPPSMNERLNRNALELLRAAPADLRMVGPSFAALRDRLASYSARSGPTDYEHLFTLQKRQQILDRYAAGNQAIAQRNCGREDGVLFKAPPPDGDAEPYPGLPTTEAMEMLLEAWDWAFDEITRLRQENINLRQRASNKNRPTVDLAQ